MGLNNYRGSFFWFIIVATLIVMGAAILAAWFITEAIGGDLDQPCLTKQAARAKYPGAWLYWHGPNRCWDNRKGGAAYASRAATWGKQNSLRLPKPSPDPNGNVQHHSGRPIIPDPPKGPSVAYPTMLPGGGTTSDMLRPGSITGWPLIMDFDVDPPRFIPWEQRIAATLDAK